jgi:DNA-binding transcriptional ArsR family regulator
MEKMLQVMEDPEAIKIMNEPNAGRILYILREGELSAKQIHSKFNADYDKKKTLTSIYRYLSQLEKKGFVKVSREELKKKHMIMKYYVRTAKFFVESFDYISENSCKELEIASTILSGMYGIDRERAKKELLEILKIDMDINTIILDKHGALLLEEEKKSDWEKVRSSLKMIWPLIIEKERGTISKAVSLLK